ncbi:MAG: hypothetical protein ACI959_001933 [Limisphaerales bacterium]|jgi:hypothetical protein
MKSFQKITSLSLLLLMGVASFATAVKRSFYEIMSYSISSLEQEQMMDVYLKDAYLPAMHRQGISHIGVFKPRSTEEDTGKKVYILTPLKSQKELLKIEEKLAADAVYQSSGGLYINAMFDKRHFDRFETIILRAFSEMPQMNMADLSSPKSDRFYELRSYEGPTEKYYRKKVEMFNAGGEVTLFEKLNFNAVFYGEVITGSHMPNLMYMTTFENEVDRDEHWKAFVDSQEWTALKADAQYANTVSKNTQDYLYPTDYSDI